MWRRGWMVAALFALSAGSAHAQVNDFSPWSWGMVARQLAHVADWNAETHYIGITRMNDDARQTSKGHQWEHCPLPRRGEIVTDVVDAPNPP